MENIKKCLEEGVVTFTFTKANGETRVAHGTRILDPAVATGYSNEHAPKGTGRETPGVVPYWDIDKEAWRSVREDSIISIDKVVTRAELFGGNLFEGTTEECSNCEDCVCGDTCPDCKC